MAGTMGPLTIIGRNEILRYPRLIVLTKFNCFTRCVIVPPFGQILLHGYWVRWIVKPGAELTSRTRTPENVVLLPPEIFIVKGIVLVQHFEIICQIFNGRVIKGIYVRLGRGYLGVIAVQIQHDWDDVETEIVEEFLCDVIQAHRILERDDEFVVTLHIGPAFSLFIVWTFQSEISLPNEN